VFLSPRAGLLGLHNFSDALSPSCPHSPAVRATQSSIKSFDVSESAALSLQGSVLCNHLNVTEMSPCSSAPSQFSSRVLA